MRVDGGVHPGGPHHEQRWTDEIPFESKFCHSAHPLLPSSRPPSWWRTSSRSTCESSAGNDGSPSTEDDQPAQLPHRSSMKGSRGWSIVSSTNFDEVVRIQCDFGDEAIEFSTLIDHAHHQNRALWHLHGQVCEADTAKRFLTAWATFHVPETMYGGASSFLQETFAACAPGTRTGRHDTSIVDRPASVIVHSDFPWVDFMEANPDLRRRRRLFVETWYLSRFRAHVCIRSRRVAIDHSASQQQFEQRCVGVWSDVIQDGASVSLVHVTPKPQSLMATVAHFLVIEGELRQARGYILTCPSFPVLAKHRAVLHLPFNSVQDLYRNAQEEHMCAQQDRPCFVEDLAGPSRKYMTYEVPRIRHGALISGGVLVDHDNSDNMDEDTDDDDSTSDHSSQPGETEVPASDDHCSDLPDGDSSCEGSQGNETHYHESSPAPPYEEASRVLPWSAIPTAYKVLDVLGEGPNSQPPSWLGDTSFDFHVKNDVVSLMQRERSRSREPGATSHGDRPSSSRVGSDGPPVADPLPMPDGSDQEESTPDSPLTFNWTLIYSNMPEDPPPVIASIEGPTVQEAEAAIGFPAGAVVDIFPVRSLANAGIEYVSVVECREDHVRRASEVSLLFDIVAKDPDTTHNPSGSPHLFHSHHIARMPQTYGTLTGTLGLTHILRNFGERARLYHNGEWWRPEDDALRRLENGDHLEAVFDSPSHFETDYAVALSTWIMHQGLELWPSLREARNANISQTMPFAIQAESEGWSCAQPEDLIPGLAYHTWYIHHHRHTVCEESRIILFQNNPQGWRSNLERIWRDRMLQGHPFSLTWVVPQPPPANQDHGDSLPHVIIEQGHRTGHIASLISFHDHDSPPITRTARSIQERWNVPYILHTTGIDQECQHSHTCWVTYEDMPVHETDFFRRPTGQALTVHKRGKSHATTDADLSSFMQRPVRLTSDGMLVQEPSTGSTAESPEAVEHPLAVQSNTGGTIIDDRQPVDVRAIQHLEHLFFTFSECAYGEDRPSAIVATYLLIPGRQPRCAFPRFAWIREDSSQWKDNFVNLWRDILHPGAPVEIFTVLPQPHQNTGEGRHISAFVLLTQHRAMTMCPSLITLAEPDQFLHIAQLLPSSLSQRDVLERMGLHERCMSPNLEAICVVSQGNTAMENLDLHELYPGASIVVGIFPLAASDRQARYQYMERHSLTRPIEEFQDDMSFLQTAGQRVPRLRIRSSARLIAGAVAHAQQPVDHRDPHDAVVHILPHVAPSPWTVCELHVIDASGVFSLEYSDFNELMKALGPDSNLWHTWRDISSKLHAVALRKPVTHTVIYIPFPSPYNDATKVFAHQAWPITAGTEIAHMSFLHSKGQHRAAVHSPPIILSDLVALVSYSQQEPQLERRDPKHKEPTPWPQQQPGLSTTCWAQPSFRDQQPCDTIISLPGKASHIADLLNHPWINLRHSTGDLGLPDPFVLTAPPCIRWSDYDRIVVCTDGSSCAHDDTHEHRLSWAFVVIGETYGGACDFLGWAGEKVALDPSAPSHIRSKTTHSTRAEKEALTWATLWRVTHQQMLPTAFLSDSSAALATALGDGGDMSEDSARILRSAIQTLQTRLPGQALLYEHTRGHAGQFWNELADQLATVARCQALPPTVHPPHEDWQELLPHLSLLLSVPDIGVDLERDCICVPCPCIPVPDDSPDTVPVVRQPLLPTEVSIRCASANVMSLYQSQAGGAGKVQYLQAQFLRASIHIVGVQETRGFDGVFETQDWIRFAAAGDNGHHGVELWVNKSLPYARQGPTPLKFRKHHFAITDKSPRHLMVRVQAPGVATWIFVGHAPHGGIPLDARVEWWQQMSRVIQTHHAEGDCIVCIDANATTGFACEPHAHDVLQRIPTST
eukprot:Skav229641  [mRNA]  locus=scaffold649:305538:311334:+ [translate_table: standard]